MKVKDVMTTDVVSVPPGASLKEAARLMVERRISGLPVVDASGGVLGVISEGDLLVKERGGSLDARGFLAWLIGAQEDGWSKLEARVVGEAMTTPAATIGPERPVATAATLMLDREVNRLPVVDRDGRLVGIVTRADLVRAFARADAEVAREIRDEVIGRQLWLAEDTVTVEVAAGEVVLRGSVERRGDAEVLPKLAAHVPGVVAVSSEVTWREDA
jgi:CBS domain-containing protein